MSRQTFVSEIGVYPQGFFRLYPVVRGELCRRGAHRVHQSNPHHDLSPDTWRQVVHIDISQFREDLLFAFVHRIELAIEILELEVGVQNADGVSSVCGSMASISRNPLSQKLSKSAGFGFRPSYVCSSSQDMSNNSGILFSLYG